MLRHQQKTMSPHSNWWGGGEAAILGGVTHTCKSLVQHANSFLHLRIWTDYNLLARLLTHPLLVLALRSPFCKSAHNIFPAYIRAGVVWPSAQCHMWQMMRRLATEIWSRLEKLPLLCCYGWRRVPCQFIAHPPINIEWWPHTWKRLLLLQTIEKIATTVPNCWVKSTFHGVGIFMSRNSHWSIL